MELSRIIKKNRYIIKNKYLFNLYLSDMQSIFRLLLVVVTSILSSVVVIYTIGMDQSERHFIQEKVLSKVFTIFHK